MRIFFFCLLVFCSNCIFAQSADFRIYKSQDHLMLDVTLNTETSDWIGNQDAFGGENIATPFQINNYLNEHMECKINNEIVQFTIESSVSNKSKVIVNFSSSSDFKMKDVLTFSTNAFVEDFEGWKNNVRIELDQEINHTLSADNKLVTYKLEDK